MLSILKNKIFGISLCIIATVGPASLARPNNVFSCTGYSTHYDHTFFMGSLAIDRATNCAQQLCYNAGFSYCDDVFDTDSWDCNTSITRVCGFARVRGSR